MNLYSQNNISVNGMPRYILNLQQVVVSKESEVEEDGEDSKEVRPRFSKKPPLLKTAARASLLDPKKMKAQPRGNSRGPRAVDIVLPFNPDPRFDLRFELDSEDSDEEEYRPTIEPLPDSESDPEPTPPPTPPPPPPPKSRTPPPPRSPTPPPRTPPPPTPPAKPVTWLPHDPETDEKFSKRLDIFEPVDFYIDAVRFLPDNISHCK
ncbi:hypothetical protein SK128_002100, partial [Halocaridina rubra]